MSYTNSTPNYGLPQWLAADKPKFLTDINNAFSTIDTQLKNANDTANTADDNATSALSIAGQAATTAEGAATVSGQAAALAQSVNELVGTLNAKMGTTSIATIGDGTVTGAIDALNDDKADNTDLDNYVLKNKVADITIDFTGKTFGQLVAALTAQLDFSKITINSYAKVGANYFRPTTITSSLLMLTYAAVLSTGDLAITYYCNSGNNHAYKSLNGVNTEISSDSADTNLYFYY